MTLPALVHGGGHAADCWDLTVDEIRRIAPELSVWPSTFLGAERIMFAADNPFASAAGGVARHFLDVLDDDDRDKIASGNWDRMCTGIRR